jgi:hypothetical protein
MNPTTPSQGPATGIQLHRQRLYALIFAGVAFLGMFLPWSVISFMGLRQTSNGFTGWGILSFFGIAGAVIASLLGDKTREFDQTFKYVAIGSFVAIILGAFIPFMQIVNGGSFAEKSGFGVWLCLIAGIIGLLWITGVLKMPSKMPGSSSLPPAPPPPPHS